MDEPLLAWLDDTFEIELKLAKAWLQVQVARKLHGLDPEPRSRWGCMYQDSGSYLDIRIIQTQNDQNLQVIQLSPLILSDGARKIEATFSGAVPRSGLPNPPLPLHSIVPIREYTIRWTSYGPPSRKLRLILPTVHLPRTLQREVVGQPTPINNTSGTLETIAAALSSLQNEADSIYATEHLRSAINTMPLGESATSRFDANNLDGRFEGSETQMGTQFGTQPTSRVQPVALHERIRPSSKSPTRRAPGDTTPTPAKRSVAIESSMLLSLLDSNKQTQYRRQAHVRPVHQDHPVLNRQSALVHAPSPPTPSIQQQPDSVQNTGAMQASPKMNHQADPSGFKITANSEHLPEPRNMLDEEVEMPMDITNREEAFNISHTSTANELGLIPAWMAGYTFNAASTEVSKEQAALLNMPQAWHKPEAGHRYPAANIPIRIYNDINDRLAATRAAQDTNMEGNLSDSDVEEIVEPLSMFQDETQSNDGNIEDQHDDLPTSPIPWSSSPVLEAPRRLCPPDLGLPPDSSFEAAAQVLHNNADHDRLLPKPPTQPNLEQVSSKEMLTPTSSPPPHYDDSDGDDDMELTVPQGLGEDISSRSSHSWSHPQPANSLRLTSMTGRSVVEVVETPHMKDKSGHTRFPSKMQSSSRDSVSSGEPKNISSTSIVFSTYLEPALSSAAGTEAKGNSLRQSEGLQSISPSMPNVAGDTLMEDPSPTIEHKIDNFIPADESGRVNGSSKPQLTESNASVLLDRPVASPASAQLQTIQIPTSQVIQSSPPSIRNMGSSHGTTGTGITIGDESLLKRKPNESPSKQESRYRKRKFIKIRPLGEGLASPISQNLMTSFRQERKFEVERIRDARRASFSGGSNMRPRIGPNVADVHVKMDLDIELDHAIPHDEAELMRQSAAKRVIQSHAEMVSSERLTAPSSSGNIEMASEPALPTQNTNATQPIAGGRVMAPKFSPTPRGDVDTVMREFKREYPFYTGDVKHFVNLCAQMYRFELEDKMVPKWQWDDYLIRNRTDYVAFAAEHVNAGEDASTLPSYHQFYKDRIRDTVHTKGIIKDTATLITALEELGYHIGQDPKCSHRKPRSSLPRSKDRSILPSHIEQGSITQLNPRRMRDSFLKATSRTQIGPGSDDVKIRQPVKPKDISRTMNQVHASQSGRDKRHILPWQTDGQPSPLGLYNAPVAEIERSKMRHSLPTMPHQAQSSQPGLDHRRNEQRHAVASPSQPARQCTPTPTLKPRETQMLTQKWTTKHTEDANANSANAFREFADGFKKLTFWSGSREEKEKTEWPASVASRPPITRNYDFDFLIFDSNRC